MILSSAWPATNNERSIKRFSTCASLSMFINYLSTGYLIKSSALLLLGELSRQSNRPSRGDVHLGVFVQRLLSALFRASFAPSSSTS